MLPKNYRLTKEKDIKRVLSTGKPFFSPFFRLKYAKNGLEQSRFSVVVSAKVSKKAVIRNKLRRQVQEIIWLNLDKISSGLDFVINLKLESLKIDREKLEKDILAKFSKIKPKNG